MVGFLWITSLFSVLLLPIISLRLFGWRCVVLEKIDFMLEFHFKIFQQFLIYLASDGWMMSTVVTWQIGFRFSFDFFPTGICLGVVTALFGFQLKNRSTPMLSIASLIYRLVNPICCYLRRSLVSVLVSRKMYFEVFGRRKFILGLVSCFCGTYISCRLFNPEQVLAATPHKTPTVRPPAPYHENYSN